MFHEVSEMGTGDSRGHISEMGDGGLSLGAVGGRQWWSGAEIHIVLKKLVIKRCITI